MKHRIEYFNPHYNCIYCNSDEELEKEYNRIVNIIGVTGIYVNAPSKAVLNN